MDPIYLSPSSEVHQISSRFKSHSRANHNMLSQDHHGVNVIDELFLKSV